MFSMVRTGQTPGLTTRKSKAGKGKEGQRERERKKAQRTEIERSFHKHAIIVAVVPQVELAVGCESAALVLGALQLEELVALFEPERAQLLFEVGEEGVHFGGSLGHLDLCVKSGKKKLGH